MSDTAEVLAQFTKSIETATEPISKAVDELKAEVEKAAAENAELRKELDDAKATLEVLYSEDGPLAKMAAAIQSLRDAYVGKRSVEGQETEVDKSKEEKGGLYKALLASLPEEFGGRGVPVKMG